MLVGTFFAVDRTDGCEARIIGARAGPSFNQSAYAADDVFWAPPDDLLL